jgi:hypothetical protein
LKRVETQVGAGRQELAVAGARSLRSLLEQALPLTSTVLNAGHFPPVFEVFRRTWERAAETNAGQPVAAYPAQSRLLRWRLHDLLAHLTGELQHSHEAARAWPNTPSRERGWAAPTVWPSSPPRPPSHYTTQSRAIPSTWALTAVSSAFAVHPRGFPKEEVVAGDQAGQVG